MSKIDGVVRPVHSAKQFDRLRGDALGDSSVRCHVVARGVDAPAGLSLLGPGRTLVTTNVLSCLLRRSDPEIS